MTYFDFLCCLKMLVHVAVQIINIIFLHPPPLLPMEEESNSTFVLSSPYQAHQFEYVTCSF